MIDLQGPSVRLRAFHPDELDLLVAERRADPSMPPKRVNPVVLRAKIRRSGRFVEGRLDLAVDADGTLIGSIEARRPKRAMPPGVYEIGISLIPERRGHGHGTEAVHLLTEYLFRSGEAHRVQASTALTNASMRSVLEKLGYRFEGVLRAFMPTRDGGREDYVLYAVTLTDWEKDAVRPAEVPS